MEILSAAHQLHHAALRPGRWAAAGGWTLMFFAVATIPMGFIDDPVLVVVGIAFVLAGAGEFVGRKKLLAFDPGGYRLLGWNQVFLMLVLMAYGTYEFFTYWLGPHRFDIYMKEIPEAMQTLEAVKNIEQVFYCVMYGGLVLLSPVFQGGSAVRRFRAVRKMEAFLQQTPPWAIETLKKLA